MTYEIHVTTSDGASHSRPVESIEGIDAFLAQVQYRGEGRLVAVSTSPIKLVYSNDIKSITVTGVSKEEIDEHVRKQHEAQQAQFREAVVEKANYARNTGAMGAGMPWIDSQLANAVRG